MAEAAAPLLFGYSSQYVFNGPGTSGLEDTFLLCLLPPLVAGLLALPARRTYPRDVATAAASVNALATRTARRHVPDEPRQVALCNCSGGAAALRLTAQTRRHRS